MCGFMKAGNSVLVDRQRGIHSFCIIIDETVRGYLPNMYGAANYAVIDDVAQLPLKVSDIDRRLTTR
jgi:nitric oxide reductase NorD protein